jgi:predicted transcriptional regulator
MQPVQDAQIIDVLSKGDRTVKEIADVLDVPGTQVLPRLNLLRGAGDVVRRIDGTNDRKPVARWSLA